MTNFLNPFSTAKCEYCGNNPVPHFVTWYFESLNVLFTPLRGFLLHNPLSRFFKTGSGAFWLAVIKVLALVKLVSYNADEQACKVPRAKVLWQEANRRGFRMRELRLFGKGIDAYRVDMPSGKQFLFSGLPRPNNYDDSILEIMDDKALLKQRLASKGLPVPKGGAVWNWFQAKRLFKTLARPVIVKPRLGSRGRHSTTYVHTEAELHKAFRVAKQLCFWVVVEEMLEGPVYRATAINYRLGGVLRGDPPHVTGDGIHTIETLVTIKNNAPHSGVKNIVLDTHAEKFLARQGLNRGTVLEKGKVATLTEKIGVNYGGSSSEDYEICHPENKAMFEKAAQVLGDPIVGFDFIIPDITRPYTQQRCGFLEANSLPFINLHHDPLLGTPRNVAGMVWDMLNLP